MNMKSLAFICFACSASSGQTKGMIDSTDQINPDAETVMDEGAEDSEDSQLIAVLDELEQHPLDLNSATADELSMVPGLDGLMVSRILMRRNQGQFTSMSELKEITGMSESLFRLLCHCVTVRSDRSRGSVVTRIRTRIGSSTRASEGFLTNSFVGSRIKSYSRVSLLAPEALANRKMTLAANVTTETDAGERLGDFVSGFIETSSPSFRTIVGDYLIESAGGLVFPRKYGTTASADVLSPSRFATRAAGYTSAEENFFFRGVFAEATLSGIGLSVFFSRRHVNGTLDPSGSITSLDQSGLFRTASELSRKSVALQTVTGGLVDLSPVEHARIGIKYFSSRLDHPLIFRGGQRRSMGSFGVDAKFLGTNWILFGEAARDEVRTVAAHGGFQFEPDPTFALLFVAHARPKNYEEIFGVSFDGEAEQEWYAGIQTQTAFGMNIRCSFSRGSDQWNNAISPFPTLRERLYGGIEIKSGPNTKGSLEYRKVEGSVRLASYDMITESRRQQSVRMTIETNPPGVLQSRSRIELGSVSYDNGTVEHGLLAYQDLRCTLGDVTLCARLVIFDTGSFDSRLYEYEDDLRGVNAIPALFGKGTRSYLLLFWRPLKGIQLGAKYSSTLRDGVRSVGSGYDEIQGDQAGSASIQVDMQF